MICTLLTFPRALAAPIMSDDFKDIRTVNSDNLTAAHSYVELVQAPASHTAADAILTIGNNLNAYYRHHRGKVILDFKKGLVCIASLFSYAGSFEELVFLS